MRVDSHKATHTLALSTLSNVIHSSSSYHLICLVQPRSENLPTMSSTKTTTHIRKVAIFGVSKLLHLLTAWWSSPTTDNNLFLRTRPQATSEPQSQQL